MGPIPPSHKAPETLTSNVTWGTAQPTCRTPNDNVGGWVDNGNRCKPKGSLFSGRVVGFTQIYYDPSKHPKAALTWAPEGSRSRGKPKDAARKEPQKKKEQHWVLAHGARQQWLLVTVWHGKGECLTPYPLRVMVKWKKKRSTCENWFHWLRIKASYNRANNRNNVP